MAVFFKNDCKFKNCARTFSNLSSLVEHIETAHVDFDENIVTKLEEDIPKDIHPSYVLRFSSCRQQPREIQNFDMRPKFRSINNNYLIDKYSGIGANYNNLSKEDDRNFSDSSSSTDSSITMFNNPAYRPPLEKKKHSYAPFVVPYNKSNIDGTSYFTCTVVGCKKKYKNPNGLKYHLRNGHKLLCVDSKFSFRHFGGSNRSKRVSQNKFEKPYPPPVLPPFEVFKRRSNFDVKESFNEMLQQSIYAQHLQKNQIYKDFHSKPYNPNMPFQHPGSSVTFDTYNNCPNDTQEWYYQ